MIFNFKTKRVRELEHQLESLERSLSVQSKRNEKLLDDKIRERDLCTKLEIELSSANAKLEELHTNREEMEGEIEALKREKSGQMMAYGELLSSHRTIADERDAAKENARVREKLLTELRAKESDLHRQIKEANDQRRGWQTRSERLYDAIFKARTALTDAWDQPARDDKSPS